MEKVRIIIETPSERLNETLAALEGIGLNWIEVKRSRAHKTDQETARMVYGLYKSGLAVRDISRRTKVSRSTVSKIVREPAVYGLSNKPLGRQGKSEDV